MPTFMLIRHAENDYLKQNRLACRRSGVHLNEEGRVHARQLADRLAPRLREAPIAGIFSSPMERAIETAEPLAQTLGKPILIRDGLVETDCGQWAGKTVKSLSRLKLWKMVQQSPSLFRFPGGESFPEIQQRFVAELDRLKTEFTDPKAMVLCFSHADPIKLAVAYILGMRLDDFQKLVISPASVTVIEVDETTTRLLALNAFSEF